MISPKAQTTNSLLRFFFPHRHISPRNILWIFLLPSPLQKGRVFPWTIFFPLFVFHVCLLLSFMSEKVQVHTCYPSAFTFTPSQNGASFIYWRCGRGEAARARMRAGEGRVWHGTLTFYSTTTFVFKLVINISFRKGRYLLFEAQWGAVQKNKTVFVFRKICYAKSKISSSEKNQFFLGFLAKRVSSFMFLDVCQKKRVSRPIRNFLIR